MGKNKLFVLMGKSGSGKSTLEQLINESGYANKVISTTTRKPRSYEKDTVDYYFISQEVFNIYLKQGQYAEHSTYPTVWGKASYGINKNDIKLDKGSAVAVVNPDGYFQLLDNLGEENVVGIYIERNDRERVISAIRRDKSDDLKAILKEISRRLEADDIDFADTYMDADYVVENENIDIALKKIIQIIEKETR